LTAIAPPRRELPDFAIRSGPFTHLAGERERLGSLRWQHFDARQVGVTLGAEISGVNLAAPLGDEVVAELRAALHDYKVIFFRDQALTPAAHTAFARRFGPLEVHPVLPSNAEDPTLARFEKSADVSGYENLWHHDVTWRPEPSIAAILHAIEAPSIGGDTLFSDMYAAYESLDDDTRAVIENLDAVHDFTTAFRAMLPEERVAEMRALHPSVRHPVVCTHPVTGRRHLYVNRAFVSHFDGWSREESLALLDRLCRTADSPEHQCRFQWAADSVAVWDNRAVQHYASSDYWPQVRIMERASVIGPRPER
jgi:alpha-ketoglutarate-dependent taurine dioxygenase